MKHVFEFRGNKPQCMVSHEHDYGGTVKEPPTYKGSLVSVLVCDVIERKDGSVEEGDAMHFEGSLATIRDICNQILGYLDFHEQMSLERNANCVANSRKCEVCECWYNRYPARGDTADDDPHILTHGDGRGMSCFGDGRALIGGWFVETADGKKHTTDLKKGDKFTCPGPGSFDKHHVYEALEDATKYGVIVRRP